MGVVTLPQGACQEGPRACRLWPVSLLSTLSIQEGVFSFQPRLGQGLEYAWDALVPEGRQPYQWLGMGRAGLLGPQWFTVPQSRPEGHLSILQVPEQQEDRSCSFQNFPQELDAVAPTCSSSYSEAEVG